MEAASSPPTEFRRASKNRVITALLLSYYLHRVHGGGDGARNVLCDGRKRGRQESHDDRFQPIAVLNPLRYAAGERNPSDASKRQGERHGEKSRPVPITLVGALVALIQHGGQD